MVKDKARLCLVGVITWIIIPGLGSVVSATPHLLAIKFGHVWKLSQNS